MSDITEAPVIIVGGGPVGVGLALELALHGVRSIVVEKYAVPQPIPKGQNLTQRTLEHVRRWGAEKELRAARTIPAEYGMGGLTAYGTLLGDHHYDWLRRELVGRYYFADNERLPQYATESVLRARAAAFPEIAFRYGWQALAVEEDGDGVRVLVGDAAGRTEELRGAYVVGCDGSRSLVRESAGLTQTASDTDRLMVLLVFRSRELHDLLERYPGKSFYSVLHPDHDGYWLFLGRVDLGETWFFHAPVPAGTTRDNFDFTGYVQRAVGAPFAAAIDHIGFWNLRFAVADRYRRGRMFIAGDAAHSHPPYGGYGVNSGFEDARNLGWKLAATLQGWGGEALLDSYSAERQPVFASTARDFIARSIEVDRRFLAAFDPSRDRAAFEAEWQRRATGALDDVDAFEPHYEGSPIVFGPPGGRSSAIGRHDVAARPGHHLSPPDRSPGRGLFDAMGPGFALIVARPGILTAGLEASARRRRIPLTVVRPEADLAGFWGADLILVRPDHFVAWAGSANEAEADDPWGTIAG